MKNFKDKVAVITGGASGFGREFALIGTRLGMKLVLADVQQDALDNTVAELQGLPCVSRFEGAKMPSSQRPRLHAQAFAR